MFFIFNHFVYFFWNKYYNSCRLLTRFSFYFLFFTHTHKPRVKPGSLGLCGKNFFLTFSTLNVALQHEGCLKSIKIGNSLTGEQKQRLLKLLEEKYQAFQLNDEDVGRTHLIEHKIDLAGNRPIKQCQFKIPQALGSEVNKQVNDLLKANMIEESNSPWCSPMMIIKQMTREGTIKYRIVIDFRKLNEITIKDSFPLHRMDQALEALGGAMYF
jgi:hypothetical protein